MDNLLSIVQICTKGKYRSLVVFEEIKEYNTREIKQIKRSAEMKQNIENTQDIQIKPLLTGDYRRDNAISEQEKTVEAAIFLWSIFRRLFKKDKNI